MNRVRGFTLIEVLVALAILSFGLLGIAAMQVTGVRANQGSYFRSQATHIAMDMAERMYANRPGTRLGQYNNFSGNATTNCAALPSGYKKCSEDLSSASRAACTTAEMSIYDRFRIYCGMPTDAADTAANRLGGVRDLLPDGTIGVSCADQTAATSTCEIIVTWSERAQYSNSTGTATTVSGATVAAQTQTVRVSLQP